MKLRHALCGALAPALLAVPAPAQGPIVIHCEIPTSPKSLVPGALDLSGMPAVTRFKALEDVYVSPDGTTWILKARTEQGSDLETILMIGMGAMPSTSFAQEGQPIPNGAPGELFDFFGSGGGRFNDIGQFAYSARARGGVSSVFQKVLFWNGATTTIPFQMGDLYTGLMDLSPNPSGDELVGNSIGSIHLLNNGVIGAQDSTIQMIHTSRRPAIFYDLAMFHQTGVTTVTGFGGVGTETIETLDGNGFYTTPDGTRWIALGEVITGSTTNDDVLIVDGEVRLQEASPVPGSALILGAVFDAQVASGGTWYARGRDNSSTAAAAPDWALVDGTVVVETGDQINGNSAESYGDTFYAFAANDTGGWALACNTDDPDPARDSVIVVNGFVIAREGDPVDVDGNGLFDDGAFIGRGNNTLAAFKADSLRLSDAGALYAILNLNDGMGNDLGSSPSFGTPDAFVVFDASNLCTPTVYCTSETNSAGCTPAIGSTGTPSASAGSGFLVTANQVLQGQFGVLIYSTTGPAAMPFGGGVLCVQSPIVRTPVQTSGGASICGGLFSFDFNAWIAGGTDPALVEGTTVWSQYWSRDPGVPSGTNLSDALRFVICP